MFTYVFLARAFVFSSLFFLFRDDMDKAIYSTNVAIVLAILATIPKEKE